MNTSKLEKQQNGTIKLTITIPEEKISKAQEDVLAELVKSADIKGFRKGKAPKKLVEEKLSPEQVRENVLKKVLPSAYIQAVEENNLKPIMNPKIHVEKIEEGKDWVFEALTCEMPEIDLGTFKEKVKSATAKTKIIIPGKEEEKPKMEDIVGAVLESAKLQVPTLLVEQEADRLLAQLLDDVKRLGLSLEQYLQSTKRSADELRLEYMQRAENDIKLEFILQKIAEVEKISVDPREIEEAILKAKTPSEKQSMEANKYLLASILRQQKTLDFLMNL